MSVSGGGRHFGIGRLAPFSLASSRMPGLPDVDLKTGKFDRVRLSKLFILSLIVRCIVAGQSDYQ